MFLILSRQILKMFLLILVGFLCCRKKLIDTQGNRALSNLLLMVVNPCVIVNAFQTEFSAHLLKGLLCSLFLALLTHIIGILIGKLLIPAGENPDYPVERFCCMYSNCGFMGIPLISGIFGSEGVLYITAYMVIFNIFCWTHGLLLMSGSASLKQLKKVLVSPVILAIFSGLFLFAAQIRLPGILSDSLGYLADMNTPLGMLIAGIALAESDLLAALKDKRLYLVSFIKLLLIPGTMAVLLAFLPWDYTVRCTILVAAACPTATTGTMFALRYHANYKQASEIFAFTTVACLVTIPVIVSIASPFFLK